MNMNIKRSSILGVVSAVAVTLSMGWSAVFAKTPDDSLIMAKDISDIITLDPAEVFEFSAGEIIANLYDRVMMYEPEDLTTLVGGVAESYSVNDKGKNITLKIREGQNFHSGNPVTAEDVAFSLQRVIKLNKSPSFILSQFGWTPKNVDTLVQAIDAKTVSLDIEADLSPGLVLNALSAGVGSVVDKKIVLENEVDGDLGAKWLKNNSAGSGAFSLKSWNSNETVVLNANPSYRLGGPDIARVFIRHISEPSAQRLLVESGDVDIARNLTPDQIAGLSDDVIVETYGKSGLVYMASNDSHKILGNPKVREALRYVIDYQGMADTFLKGQFDVHQAIWPAGFWAGLEEKPFVKDIKKAKKLLAEAGYPNGFSISLDTLKDAPFPDIAQTVQQGLAEAGIKSSIVLSEGKTLWPKYRARRHELIIAKWSPDYADPHSNADAFAHNPDNREEAGLTGKLTWRTAWSNKNINDMTEAAAKELDLNKRLQMYLELQRNMQQQGPFSIMFQQGEQTVLRKGVDGFVNGPNFDMVFYRNVTK